MSAGFFVTGMPLTGMPWLSVFLTTDRSVCYPEPLKDMNEPEDIERLMDAKGYDFVGIADSAMTLFPDVLRKMLCPVILLTRSPKDCVKELVVRGGDPEIAKNYVTKMEHAVERAKVLPGVLTVQAIQMRERRVAQQVFWHCLPGLAFDQVKFDLLLQLEITANPYAVLSASKNISGMQRMFRDRFEHLGAPLQ